MRYLCTSRETCPTTGRDHWQTYVYYKQPVSCSTVAKYFGVFIDPDKCIQRGTATQARDYVRGACEGKTLNDSFEEWGTLPKQGERNDLCDLRDQLKNGLTLQDLRDQNPMAYHQYGRTLEKLEDDYLQRRKRTSMTKGLWIWGPTECGKTLFTELAAELHGDPYCVPYEHAGWCDGYMGETMVVLDDFRGQVMFNTLLRWIDRSPYAYMTRRGRRPVPFVSEIVIITSPMPPEEVYTGMASNDNINQLLRRVQVVHLQRPMPHRDWFRTLVQQMLPSGGT